MITAHEHPSRSDRFNALAATMLVGSDSLTRMHRLLVSLVIDLGAPVVLSGLALHELLYNQPPWPVWVLVTALIWVLFWRRRRPIAVFAVTLAIVLALSTAGVDSAADAALLIGLYSVAAHRPFRFALLCAVLLEIGVVFVSQRFAPAGSIDDAVVLLTGLAAATLFLGTTLRSRRSYLASVEDRAQRLEREREQDAQLAALAERARIAREMHDIVGHGLSVVITLAEGAAAVAESEPKRAKVAMQQVAAGGRQSLSELRTLFGVLRDDADPQLAPQPGLSSLEGLVQDVERTGLHITLELAGDTSTVSETAQATLYRIAQESLTNVVQHAIGASVVTVTMAFTAERANFVIHDNGAQSRDCGLGNGIRGMRERVALFDGELETARDTTGWLVVGFLRLAG